MKIASIDIGTNTVILLIALVNKKNNFKTLQVEYRMPRLGKNLIKGGKISEDRIEAFLETLSEYYSIIEKEKCDVVLLNATAAMRNASNSDKIVSIVKEKFNLDIKIITGKKEAELSFLGASSVIENNSQKLLIDIGGASTEIICGNNGNIDYVKSFELGAVKLTDMYVKNNPVLEKEFLEMNEVAKKYFSEIKNISLDNFSAVGIAGTPTSLSCIMQNLKKYDSKKVEGSNLSKKFLKEIVLEMKNMSSKKKLEIYGKVITGREDIILAGSIILLNIMELLGIENITVSGKGLREGMVIEYLSFNSK